VSPATGRLDAMRWGVPPAASVESAATAAALATRLETLLGLGPTSDARLEAAPRRYPPPEPAIGKPAPAFPESEPERREAAARLLPAAPAAPEPPAAQPEPSAAPAEREAAPTPPPVQSSATTVPKPVPAAPAARPRKPTEPKIFVPPRRFLTADSRRRRPTGA
jgi:hypothetical protein